MHTFIKLFPNPSFVDVLANFFLHPNEELYQSSIVKSTGCALIQVQRALKRLEEAGFIKKYKSGNRIYYKTNPSHPAYGDLKKAFFKTVLFGDLLRKALRSIKKKIHFVFIYGSFANDKASYDSDIDLFIVGELNLCDVAKALGQLSHKLNREINPTVYSDLELKKRIKNRNPFVLEVMEKSKIWLIGEEDEFEKMASQYSI